MDTIRAIIAGATGRTGRFISRALHAAPDIKIVGALGSRTVGGDLGGLLGIYLKGVTVSAGLHAVLDQTDPDVPVDFSVPEAAAKNAIVALDGGLAAVVGTTGIEPSDLKAIERAAERNNRAAVVVPNFPLGIMLLHRMTREVARVFPNVEIVELAHDAKLDAPSGTARQLAEELAEEIGCDSLRIHSIRLPGLVSHHEVIFGGEGETLTLRHDVSSREVFGPGVLLAVRKCRQLEGLITSLEGLSPEG